MLELKISELLFLWNSFYFIRVEKNIFNFMNVKKKVVDRVNKINVIPANWLRINNNYNSF